MDQFREACLRRGSGEKERAKRNSVSQVTEDDN